jgi:DNA mismatch endonuclease (patch repair protein)
LDIISPERRSELMSRISGKDTAIELTVRKGLHAIGFRYRLGGAGLPGRPDIVLPRYRAVVFVHGCFWHGHDCTLFRLPKTRPEFWAAKIAGNRERDARVKRQLRELGWRYFEVWECQLRRQSTARRALVIRKLGSKIRRGNAG